MTTYIKGIDVSHWEPEIDWTKLKAQDFHFVFVEATKGLTVDPLFSTLWNGAKEAGMLRGAFHFIDPRIDGATQAEAFLKVATFEPGDLPPVLDLEDIPDKYEQDQETRGKKGVKGAGTKVGGGKKGTKGKKGKLIERGTANVPSAQIIACADAWLKVVKERTGRTPLIYSRAEYLINRIHVNAQPPSWSMNFPVWIAHYFDVPFDENLIVPNEADGWQPFTFWQYSEEGLIEGIYSDKTRTRLTEVDLDFFKGTLQDLYAFAGAALPVAEVEDPSPVAGTLTTYCIEAGDNLSLVATRFHTTLADLLAANPQITDPDLVHPGQVINLPPA